MKLFTKIIGLLAMTMLIGVNQANATERIEEDTIKVVVNGDTVVSVMDIEDLEGLEDIPDIDSIMEEVEKSLEEMESDLENITIEKDGDIQKIIITDKKGKVVDKIEISSTGDDDDKDIEIEIERDDSDKMFYGYMANSIGMNNYLEGQAFPSGEEAYYVKPFGSWSVSLESGFRFYATSWLSLDVSGDVQWYNFKLQEKNLLLEESTNIEGKPVITYLDNPDNEGDANDAIKSKLTVSYVNVNMMPVFHIGNIQSGINKRPVRIGVGGYTGYRVGAHTKNVWDEDGQKRKTKNHDNFYLNNFRYGVKAMIGVKEFNLFMNYDLNSLFEEGKGPDGKDLNAFAFGVKFII